MQNTSSEKIYAFDYLRAICCVVVVAIHIGISNGFAEYKILQDIVHYYLFCLAVPIFFQISLILFFLKRKKQKNHFFEKRFFKLVKLYLFWGLFSHVFYLLTAHEEYSNALNQLINPKGLILFILQDGYSNPFYFFFSLLFLTFFADFCAFFIEQTKVKDELVGYVGLVFSCIIVFLLPLSFIFFGENFDILPQAFNPLNFVPYIFSSLLISNYLHSNNHNSNKSIIILTVLFVFFTLFELVYFSHFLSWKHLTGNDLPIYSRVSLLFGSWLVILIASKIPNESNFVIKLLSDSSLGIYGLHTFLLHALFKMMGVPFEISAKIFALFVSVLLSVILTKIFKSFKVFQDVV